MKPQSINSGVDELQIPEYRILTYTSKNEFFVIEVDHNENHNSINNDEGI